MALLPGPFLHRLPEAIRPQLPAAFGPLHPLHMKVRGRLLQLWYGPDATIHYEIWIHERTQQLELGLHCEADAALNARLKRELSFCLFEIKHALGNGVELEEWDRGWTRLYETHPLYPLDEARLTEIGERAGLFVRTIQPIYMEIRERLLR
jgi:hypothetical protein